MKNGTPRAPDAAQRRQPVGDLLDIGTELAAQAVDRVAHLFAGGEKAAVGHHDRAGRIIGEAHVQQLRDPFVGRRGFGDHAVEHRCEFDSASW
jgi:hypothetical protein